MGPARDFGEFLERGPVFLACEFEHVHQVRALRLVLAESFPLAPGFRTFQVNPTFQAQNRHLHKLQNDHIPREALQFQYGGLVDRAFHCCVEKEQIDHDHHVENRARTVQVDTWLSDIFTESSPKLRLISFIRVTFSGLNKVAFYPIDDIYEPIFLE